MGFAEYLAAREYFFILSRKDEFPFSEINKIIFIFKFTMRVRWIQ